MMRYLIFTICFVCTIVLSAQEAFTLEEAIEYALEHNLELKNTRVSEADAQEQLIERRSTGMPKLSAGVDVQRALALPTSLIPANFVDPDAAEGEFAEVQFGSKNTITPRLDLTTQLFDFSYFVGLRAARRFKDLVREQTGEKIFQVEYQIREAYLPALILEENRQILEKNIANLERLFNSTQESYNEGFIEQLDVDRLALSLANLRTELNNLGRQKNLVYNALKFRMNYPLDAEIVATDDIDGLFIPATNDELSSGFDPVLRPEYRVMDLTRILNKMNVEVNQSQYYPKFSGWASLNYQGQGDKLNQMFWSPTAQIGLIVNVPIFDGLDKKAKVNRAKLNLESVINRQALLSNSLNLELQNARENYRSAFELLESQQDNLELAEKIYDTTLIKYREGVGSSLELTLAEQSLYDAQRYHIQAKYELLLAKMDLEKALGK